LEDFDWGGERLRVWCPKTKRERTYPLVRPVGDAVLRYIREVRPQSQHRVLFLTLLAPIRPLRHLWDIVGKRLRGLGVTSPHLGPHALRHACATHLLAEGFTLKQIGDHLGHRQPDTTRIYAKVDLAGLRQVADVNLEGLL
jgi:integrase/recombinase XerD